MPKRITDEQVIHLRESYASGALQTELASQFGISQNTVSSIATGRTRGAAGGPITPAGSRKLTSDDAAEIRQALSEGASPSTIAEEYQITQQMVSLIRTGHAYADAPGPIFRPARRSEPLTVRQVEEMKHQIATGRHRLDIAVTFGVSRWTVDSVATGRIPGRDTDTAQNNTREEVREIRTLYLKGLKQKEIAERFGMTQQAVSQIVRGAAYPTHGGPIARRQRRLTAEEIATIRAAFEAGATTKDLADRHHSTQQVIAHVVAGVTYPMHPLPADEDKSPPEPI